MNPIEENKYKIAKNFAIKFFHINKKVKSTALGEVHFNSDGFMHLIWKKSDKKHKRDWKNQVKRFHLLRYVKPILEGMTYYQEYLENLEKVKIKKKKKIGYEVKLITYWAFIAIIDNKIRIKIVLRRIGEGLIHFWSIIPIWRTEEYKDIKIVSLYKGNLQED